MGSREKLSIVSRAADEYNRGNYSAALALYHQLADLMGEKNFRANIRLCEQKLTHLPGLREIAPMLLQDIRVAAVMDEFTYHSYAPECNLLQLTPTNALSELQEFNPQLLFIESAWRGKDDLWNRKIGTLSVELKEVIGWCKRRSIPTIFWNKEDPVHFETFLTTAQQFDFVYTTDIDCVGRYKDALGHERVYLLPFACQPKIHNPIEIYDRKDAFCFAGAYYVRYPERTLDLTNFVSELPKFRPLEIFDRNYGKNDANYMFPPSYKKYIVGTLPFSEIDKAYKGYRYAVNLNSIKHSQSMFARRVYELLGCNTIVVSNFSRGVRLMFGDLVICTDSGAEAVHRLQCIVGETDGKFRLAGLRKTMLEHTYERRFSYIISKTTLQYTRDYLPKIVIFTIVSSTTEYQRALFNFSNQNYELKRLVVLATGTFLQKSSVGEVDEDLVTFVDLTQARDTTVHDYLNMGEWLAAMTTSDYYGPNYLLDIAVATKFSSSKVIGKVARFEWNEGLHLHNPECVYRITDNIPTRSSLIHRDLLPVGQPIAHWFKKQIKSNWAESGLAIDAFNYCLNGHKNSALSLIQKRVDDLTMDCGVSIDSLIGVAEKAQPDTGKNSNGEIWSAQKLMTQWPLRGVNDIELELIAGGLRISSSLNENKYEYIYSVNSISINRLLNSSALITYVDSSAGLNFQYVFLFFDDKNQRLGHSIVNPNGNQTHEIPIGTALVKFGLRVSGSGNSTIRSLLFGHRRQSLIPVIRPQRALVLTNHYPSYDDLYRNGFVHSRVQAYGERGYHFDVFRLREKQAVTYHEYQNVNVTTGDQEALAKVLSLGSYKIVLVHFLSPSMWEVLKNYPSIKVVVWVHGAEIQPWHRRDFNYETEEQRIIAKSESAKRMEFWRQLLSPISPNLTLVFVSRYFAEEVMEDVGICIPDTAYTVIHNPIDTELFIYNTKPVEQRKRILSIRPYASAKYANDLSVKAILLLKKKSFFDQLVFTIIGDGPLFDKILEPLRQFENVHIERRFLSHSEISKLHQEHGIFLCPTRMDAQGVSKDEAMSSGLVPITNAVTAIPEFVDSTCGVLAPGEDAQALADGIEFLYWNPNEFLKMSLKAANRVRNQCSKDIVINQELDLISEVKR